MRMWTQQSHTATNFRIEPQFSFFVSETDTFIQKHTFASKATQKKKVPKWAHETNECEKHNDGFT